ncbi:hypothetical protein PGT21_033464 [Puccinia graminis f. sp. tritici]|uniref:Uncharacterized protein n=1 Tax=Puccinia graminis f. sp. tritici TaxID=56615 RepID=A0A5B0M5E6_PUCGR|nr:hypothetical protein PGT21_033464 [Puccinia graminis f. sp. tritici]
MVVYFLVLQVLTYPFNRHEMQGVLAEFKCAFSNNFREVFLGSFWNITSNMFVFNSAVGGKGISFCCPIKLISGTIGVLFAGGNFWHMCSRDGSFSRIWGHVSKFDESAGGKFSVDQILPGSGPLINDMTWLLPSKKISCPKSGLEGISCVQGCLWFQGV